MRSHHLFPCISQRISSGDEAVAAHLKFFKETDTDIVKVMNEHLVPYYGMIRTPKDYYELIPSFSRNTNIIEDQIEMTKKILDGADKELLPWVPYMVCALPVSIH